MTSPGIAKAPGFPKAVVFDLDGTLVDSAADIARAVNAGFAPFGIPAFEPMAVIAMIGGGAAVVIQRAADMAGLTLSESERMAATQRFFARYAEVSAEGNGIYPGALRLLEDLGRRGVRRALCTNKSEPIAHIAAGALGVAPYLEVLVGATDTVPKKPAPDMLLACLAPFGIAPADAVMVGDSAADVGAARAAGCRVVAVDFGYSKVPARDLGADAVVSHLDDVLAALERISRG